MKQQIEIIVLGGGCFWCTEAVFQLVPGVLKVEPGYAGGATDNPTYEEVTRSMTGHAEVVRVTFDRTVVSPKTILEVFLAAHDPTSLNQQGNDRGPQYRSVVLCTNERQFAKVKENLPVLARSLGYQKPLVTEIVRLVKFYPAEECHQQYYVRHENASYCQLVINPKLAKIRQLLATGVE